MVGAQQVGEDARLSRIGYSFAAVSIFNVGQILLASTYLLDVSLYHPT
jgi:hypothetical protein